MTLLGHRSCCRRSSFAPPLRVVALGAAALAGFGIAAAASAATTYSDRFVGAEIPPITSTLGTFAGVASGELPMAWRVQIAHQPLSAGQTVAITGGTFSMRTSRWRRLAGAVTGGSVTVLERGSGCGNQTYRVIATLTAGTFAGTLTHYRRLVFGNCLIYSASIVGSATIRT